VNNRHYQRYIRSLGPILQVIELENLEQLLEGTGIHIDDLQNGETLISRTQELALYRNLNQRRENPGLALSIGLASSLSTMGPVGYAQMVSRDARHAIELAKHYRCLTMPYMRWDVLVVDDEVVHRLTDTEGLGELRPFIMEMTLAILMRQTHELVGIECQPTGLSLIYEDPGNKEAYLECFGITPMFNQRSTELRFPVRFLDCGRGEHDPVMLAALEKLCQKMASQVMREPDLVPEVLNVLRASSTTLPGIKELARHFNVSARTLRRHLQENDTSYRALLDQVRWERAQKYLRDGELALSVVAERCGFSGLHSFYSAFKRWTDSSPAYYRSQLVNCSQ